MNARQISSIGAVAALLFAGGARAFESKPMVETPGSAPSTESAANKSAKPALEKGMTAAQVEQIAGRPAEIKPLNSPEGKAETWIYRRVLDKQTRQVPVATRNVSAFTGMAADMGTTVEMEYRLEYTTVYQVTALLMFNGKLVIAKQWNEKSVRYDN